jgi:hypothetical protein
VLQRSSRGLCLRCSVPILPEGAQDISRITMKTMFFILVTRCACSSCSTISPAVRSPFSPIVPGDTHTCILTTPSGNIHLTKTLPACSTISSIHFEEHLFPHLFLPTCQPSGRSWVLLPPMHQTYWQGEYASTSKARNMQVLHEPCSRVPEKGITPVAQKVQPIWQPTWEDTQSVDRCCPSTACPSSLSPSPPANAVQIQVLALVHNPSIRI